jgi:hypothetical protein
MITVHRELSGKDRLVRHSEVALDFQVAMAQAILLPCDLEPSGFQPPRLFKLLLALGSMR